MVSAFSRDYRKGEVPDMRTFIRRYRGAPGVGSGENMTNILSNITADVSKQILDIAAFSSVPFRPPNPDGRTPEGGALERDNRTRRHGAALEVQLKAVEGWEV